MQTVVAVLASILGVLGIGAVVSSVIQSKTTARVAREQREHDREMRLLEQAHQKEMRHLDDLVHLRDDRYARLRVDAKELIYALYDLRQFALNVQWGTSANRAETERLAGAVRDRFEKARAGLLIDPDAASIVQQFADLEKETLHFQSMIGNLTDLSRTGAPAAVGYAEQVETQRTTVLTGIAKAEQQIGNLLESINAPVRSPDSTPPNRTLSSPYLESGPADAALGRAHPPDKRLTN